MRTLWLASALAIGMVATASAQERVAITGRAVQLRPHTGPPIRGELLAVTRDSAWLIAGTGRVTAVRLSDLSEATVRRHNVGPEVGMFWGLAVGVLSGLGLREACHRYQREEQADPSVESQGTSCNAVLPTALVVGVSFGTLSAISFAQSSRWRYRPVRGDSLARFARFPQGPPTANLDSLLRLERNR